ncbi:Receptor-like serine/threonine-protein kinase SD1-8 [Camellia lanceoleosa]|uniref:Receptor-like serine/threonine-protein kinase SD1-8 n=1 Tax=Camellia lanceoleosa TaxID=1840588 RepID=A0ACC0GIM0_9ERIC|nr:Receptor-like serine/threonine-protein kinase SD1-8 [Camellia lanceoleosa]
MTNTSNLHGFSILWFCTILTLFPILTTSFDTITATQPLSPGQTIVSSGNVFELGFFSPNNSTNYWYVGIWYKNVPTTFVWVANRDNPLTNSSSAFLKIGQDGNIILIDHSSNPPIWSSNQTTSNTTVAQLLDSGNFVVRRENDVNPDNYLWQSFDYPTDTLLPGMKLGWDAKTGLNRYLTPWKTTDDPSSGDYEFKLDINGFPEAFLTNKQVREYRSGPWNGLRFSGVPEMNMTSNIILFTFVMKPDEISYSFELENKSVYSRLLVNPSGVLQRYTWIETSQLWNLYWYAPKDQCDSYMECGVYGVCNTNDSPVCNCMTGFEPKNLQAWNLRDGSDGCVRIGELNCENDGFLTLKDMKLPETSSAFMNQSMSLSDCQMVCKRNCSCTAYANMDIVGGGSGCVIWTGDLLDMRQYATAEGGQDLYMRVSASDLGLQNSSNKSKQTTKIVGITVSVGVLLLGLSLFFVWWRRRKTQRQLKEKTQHRGAHEKSQDILLNEGIIVRNRDYSCESTTDELELPLFDFGTLAMATNNFCEENKLGQGGFGIVYKGMLMEGQDIAVKRLSRNSGQGVEEFKNEVRLIARLQHRNLVRLLGCCIEMEEKMLIYEYMENRSLDSILFNKERCSILNWQRRFNIICGIARGLLYLHQDSRFRIIHRDLKASNILLDREMNPKISDFGMARIFGGDQTEANTRRIVGTYGYMSPEYAMDGLFSIKSDVFSFGVLVLEIISGKKNRGFYNANQELNLLGHAWKLWRERKVLEIMDTSVGESNATCEVMRCIHVGLLCVQERAEDRPSMASVVLMLSSETASMSQPKHPGFCLGRQRVETDSLSSKQDESCTLNHVTVTILDGR